MDPKKSEGVIGPTRSVPTGLHPEQHFLAVHSALLPLATEPVLPEDLQYAVGVIVDEGDKIDEWRERQ